MNRALCSVSMAVVLLSSGALDAYDKLSPFSMVRWNGAVPEVEVGGRWWGLEAIDEAATSDILKFCKSRYGKRWDKRFCEDLVEVLSEMGNVPGATVALRLRDLQTGEIATHKQVKLTRANREAILAARPRSRAGRAASPTSSAPVHRVERKHAKRAHRKFAYLGDRYWNAGVGGAWISAAAAAQDLDQLEWHLTHEYSYRDLTKVDFKRALDAVRAQLADGITYNDFVIQLRKLLALFGDGHTRARGVRQALPRGFLPARVADIDGRLVALKPDGSALLDPDYPYLRALDGVAVETWLRVAARLAPQGSSQMVRFESVDFLPWTNYLRRDLELPPSEAVSITLESTSGKEAKEHKLPLATRPHFFRQRLTEPPQVMPGEIGYLPIPSMSLRSPQVDAVVAKLRQFKNTKGLIIDVRGNDGGNREALDRLFPLFMAANEAPEVLNVARYRMRPAVQAAPRPADGYLRSRMLFPLRAARWTKTQRAVLEKFRKKFRPRWKVDDDEFSDWHYMVATPAGKWHYDKPVIVLMDSTCFSATDIFLGAFEGRSGVTLMGTASSGGSGRSRKTTLANSQVQVRLSSMVSYRRNGKLYDGVGIVPDVVIHPTVADLLGESDSILEAARSRLIAAQKTAESPKKTPEKSKD
ncbi:MAG: S41 family peptidase [Planctomycetota bacterium]